ncbi:hypothetical protein FA15DRAFT_754657 [Coprinopsis marcescibilis]|uniref:DUF6533 domain-containing protein n=1 Tax=Coprinopsis marcescibilis TaxID=230819 RepID=A0A5C3L2J9_COPMA|nr:hypothetical protein FA15DRAFT_754657 [Coprinopsis marcescibilis]
MSRSLDAASDILRLMEHARAGNYVAASFFTLLVADYLQTFPQEVELVWFSKTSLVRAVYFMARYIGLILMTLNLVYLFDPGIVGDGCNKMYVVLMVVGTINSISSEVLLYLQVWAISGNTVIAKCFLSFQFLAILTVAGVSNHFILSGLQPIDPVSSTPKCNPTVSLHWGSVIFTTLCVSQITLITITLLLAYRKYSGWKSTLFLVFFRNGLIYWCLISVVYIAITVSALRNLTGLYFLLAVPSSVFQSALSTRSLLALRSSDHIASQDLSQLETMRFNSNVGTRDTQW